MNINKGHVCPLRIKEYHKATVNKTVELMPEWTDTLIV